MICEGVVRVESTGSFWELDFDLARYRRYPKTEQPDPIRGDGGDSLTDFVWHPLLSAQVRPALAWEREGYWLELHTTDGSGMAVAPLLIEVDHEPWEWAA